VYRNTTGPSGKFIEANPAIVKMFGYDSREEFLSVSVSDLYKNPNDRKEYNSKMLKVGSVRNEELQLQRKDGTSFIGSVSAVVVKDENDEVKYYDGAVEEITGYTETEFLDGKIRWDQAIHPEDLPALYTEDEKRLHSIPHYSYEREYRILCKDGSVRWIQEVIQNICDDSGKPVLLQGAIYDITEKKQAEKDKKTIESRFRILFERSNDAIFVVNTRTGRYLDANKAAEKLTGRTLSELVKLKTDAPTLLTQCLKRVVYWR
jgi:PAS domain S-box-containing protein